MSVTDSVYYCCSEKRSAGGGEEEKSASLIPVYKNIQLLFVKDVSQTMKNVHSDTLN